MVSVGDNQDLYALNELLTSWQVGILFELFKEEGITIKELKMMEYSHIHSLLRDCKMGEKIRFEYNMKSWRHKLGIPLNSIESKHHCCCCNKRYHENNIVENQHVTDTKELNTALNNGIKRQRLDSDLGTIIKDEQDQNQLSLSPQSIRSNASWINMMHSDEGFNFGTITAANDHEVIEKYTITLKQILRSSGAHGNTIVEFFKENNRLTNVHRSSLIQIIVDYFIENGYHLSLNLSHNLEWEILKMFPTEKLEYYRTEKRGKIYAKFSNMKRYKRERSMKASTEVEGNDYSLWPATEPEIILKLF